LKISDLFRLSYKALSERKIRAILTIVGIMIGPFALVTIGGVTRGYGDYIIKNITGLGQNIIVVTPERGFTLTYNDIERIKSIRYVMDASPFHTLQGEARVGGEVKVVFIYAVDLEFLSKAITNLKLREGYIPTSSEVAKAVIGYDIAYSKGIRTYSLNDIVSINVYVIEAGKPQIKRLNVMVAGIYDKYGAAMFLNPDQSVFVNIVTFERMLGIKEWSGILVLAESPEYVDTVANEIKSIYGRSVEVMSFLAIAQVVSSIVSAVNFVSFSASLSAFAVAVAGVASTMFTSVMERTREIGVMKALGFKDKQILALIVAEGFIMSLIGGSIGVVMGIIGSNILASRGLVIGGGSLHIRIEAKPDITPTFILQVIGLTGLVGIGGSIFPAYRAMKIPPAVALRYE